MGANYWVLLIFAPLLILVGILGFFIPQKKSLTSGAPAYNVFHIVFGLIGILIMVFGGDNAMRTFNFGFGLIDLYQYVASRWRFFPREYFRWKPADDLLHLVIGAILVAVAVLL
jgi:hypothetical protein